MPTSAGWKPSAVRPSRSAEIVWFCRWAALAHCGALLFDVDHFADARHVAVTADDAAAGHRAEPQELDNAHPTFSCVVELSKFRTR